MPDTKISALTTDSTPDRTADYLPTYDISAASTKKISLVNAGGWFVHVFGATTSPADATTYYFGNNPAGYGAAAAGNRIYIPRTGKLIKARIFMTCATGTSETSTVSFRLNDTTDTIISSGVALNTNPYVFVNTLSLAVTEDDYFSIKWATPTWATNPTSVTPSFQLWFA